MHQSPGSPEAGPAWRARTSPAKESATAVKTFGGRRSSSTPAARLFRSVGGAMPPEGLSAGGARCQREGEELPSGEELACPGPDEDHPVGDRRAAGDRGAGRRLPEELPLGGAPGPELPVGETEEDDSAGDRERTELERRQEVEPADLTAGGIDGGDCTALVGVVIGGEEDETSCRRSRPGLRTGGGEGLSSRRRPGRSELDVPEPLPRLPVPRPDAVLAADHDEPLPAPVAEEHRRAVQVEVPGVVRMNLVGPAQGAGRGVERDHARAVREIPRQEVKRIPGRDVERSGARIERRRSDDGAARYRRGNREERPQRSSRGGVHADDAPAG